MNILNVEIVLLTGLLIVALSAPQLAEAKLKKYPAVSKNKAARTC